MDSRLRIRPVALGLVWRGNALLVFEDHDPVKDETFRRPLGGGIEFGERGEETLRREFREELNVELHSVRYLQTVENLFTYKGRPGHEIVLLYVAALATPELYEQEEFLVRDDHADLKGYWAPLDELVDSEIPLYPNGLLNLLSDEGAF